MIDTAGTTLGGFRSNISSQHGENGIIAYLIASYPAIPRTCLEVGASDGMTNSNTYPLWHDGWRALLIEADPPSLQKLEHRVAQAPNVTIVPAMITPAGEASLDSIVAKAAFPHEIGVCSIDIDSNDYWILAHMKLRPSIIVLECNADFPITMAYHDPDAAPPLIRHSVRAAAELGTRMGYRTVACAGPNIILMREDVIATNPAAVPALPLAALEDKSYAAARSRYIISAKPFTFRPIYKRRPSLLTRAYFLARSTALFLKARARGNTAAFYDLGSPVYREHLKRHGLML